METRATPLPIFWRSFAAPSTRPQVGEKSACGRWVRRANYLVAIETVAKSHGLTNILVGFALVVIQTGPFQTCLRTIPGAMQYYVPDLVQSDKSIIYQAESATYSNLMISCNDVASN
jgi:hypothetical protein